MQAACEGQASWHSSFFSKLATVPTDLWVPKLKSLYCLFMITWILLPSRLVQNPTDLKGAKPLSSHCVFLWTLTYEVLSSHAVWNVAKMYFTAPDISNPTLQSDVQSSELWSKPALSLLIRSHWKIALIPPPTPQKMLLSICPLQSELWNNR